MVQTAFLLYQYWILRMVAFIIWNCFQRPKCRLKACLQPAARSETLTMHIRILVCIISVLAVRYFERNNNVRQTR
ncbi:hypothetical protein F7O43_01690 [Neisseria meningitidis]|nr:hypothetical protein [Neisseria meningitidis]MBG8805769.1 hypothetical protein [Neisseria meningitidis]MBG8840968.1 hypothetical protein [Neisseria meningitidis]MBG8844764.1 hypothetical protein [Neisseria meningitidis]MBG8861574.1 hypothetical protein [Neisseria meningitidis]